MANTKVLLEPGNEIAAFCRAEQGRQRRVAKACGMSDCQLSLALRGRRWLSSSEMEAIRKAVRKAAESIKRPVRSSGRKGT